MKYTYHSLIFHLNIRYNIKVYLIPTLLINRDNDMEDWGITRIDTSICFLVFTARYEYIIDRFNFYDLKNKNKFRIFANIV